MRKIITKIVKFAIIPVIAIALQFSISTARELTLDSAISIAIKNNTDIKIAKLEVDRAKQAILEAYGYAYPSLDLSGSFTHYVEKPKMPFPDFTAMLNNSVYSVLFKENVIPTNNAKYLPMATKLQSFSLANNYSATFQLTQVLFNYSVIQGISTSGIYRNLAEEQLKGKIASTTLNTQKAFYGVLLSQEVLNITRQSLQNAMDNLKNVQALRAQGMVSEFDALRAEVQVENIRPVVLQMESNLESIKNNFKLLIGIPQTEDITLQGEIEYNPSELKSEQEYIDIAMKNNFDLNTLNIKREFDNAMIDIERANYYPTLAFFANYGFLGGANDLNFMNYRQSVVGVSLSINLFNGLRKERRIEQQTINVKKTDESINQFKDYIAAQIKSKLIEIKKIQTNIDAQNRNIQLAQRAYEISEVRYKEGTGNQLEIENADLALRQAKTNYMQSVYQFITIINDLDNLTGTIDPKYLNINE
ncbi:MAG TPA: TolC family protein [Bacteroidota bacterium]|nr:TolC family protein [Bacteroidota bacterium]